MTKLFNDPARFTEDMLAGFLDANARYVAGVPGGVVTPQDRAEQGRGGGRRRSGHYPAFCGVGPAPGSADRGGGRQHLHVAIGR